MVFVSGNLIVRARPRRCTPNARLSNPLRAAAPLYRLHRRLHVKASTLRVALMSPRLFAQTEGETRPCKFSQVFHLMPAGASWFVFNDMFRLNYG